MEEEIFVKPIKKPKVKKQLSEKQIEGLAKGRAKMAEKRALKKAVADKKIQLKKDKEESIMLETTAKLHKTERSNKIKKVKFSEEQEKTYKQKKEMEDKSSQKFSKIRLEALKYVNTEQDLNEFEEIMKGVTKDMTRTPNDLYTYLDEHSKRLEARHPKKQPKKQFEAKHPNKQEDNTAEKKSNLSLIVEEDEQQIW